MLVRVQPSPLYGEVAQSVEQRKKFRNYTVSLILVAFNGLVSSGQQARLSIGRSPVRIRPRPYVEDFGKQTNHMQNLKLKRKRL